MNVADAGDNPISLFFLYHRVSYLLASKLQAAELIDTELEKIAEMFQFLQHLKTLNF